VALIGVISDTHGLLRPEALQAFTGVQLILHAGDIGAPAVVDRLRALAPVTAVRGNCDYEAWAEQYPQLQLVTVAGVSILMLHDRHELQPDPPGNGVRVVISGHSHKPSIEERDGVLYLNPGSAGRRRFKLPVTVALLSVEGEDVSAQIVEIVEPGRRSEAGGAPARSILVQCASQGSASLTPRPSPGGRGSRAVLHG